MLPLLSVLARAVVVAAVVVATVVAAVVAAAVAPGVQSSPKVVCCGLRRIDESVMVTAGLMQTRSVAGSNVVDVVSA